MTPAWPPGPASFPSPSWVTSHSPSRTRPAARRSTSGAAASLPISWRQPRSARPTCSRRPPRLTSRLPARHRAALEQRLAGTDAIGTDPSSVAMAASIKGFGKAPADFQVAESLDGSNTVAVTILAFRLTGVDATKLRQAIIASWLAAAASGVTTAPSTTAGKAVIVVDYGDGGPLDYVYVKGSTVFDVSTGDPALAATVLGLLP